jgi:Flp pilus assembly pilin Flp
MHLHMRSEERGVTAIEVAIGVSIAALVLIFATNTLMLFMNVGRTASEKTKAVYLAEEGIELLKFRRDDGWSNISTLSANTTYYFSVSPTTITVTPTPQVVDGYTRSFRISNVYRNSSDDIVASTTSGAVADTSSKYVTVSVAWGAPTTTISLSSIITDIDP